MFLRRDVFGDLFREMNRWQEFSRLLGRGGLANSAGLPAVNIWEDELAVHAEADLPGIDPAQIDVSVTEGNVLVIQGERPTLAVDNAVWIRQERLAGTFTRTMTLPTLVDVERIQATYEDGVLKLAMPKAEAAKPRKIAVKSV